MPSTEKRKKDKEDKESKKSKKSKKDDGGERDFQKQTKKVVKKLLDDQDPKYLTFQDVREAVKDQVLGGEEPENLAKLTQWWIPLFHTTTARRLRQQALRSVSLC